MHEFMKSCVLVFCLCIFISTPAVAHKVKVFALAEGKTISGYVYFPGGARAGDATVEIFGPNGSPLGTVQTNKNGEFVFDAEIRCDHTIIADFGEGHRAEYLIPAEDLPDSLPTQKMEHQEQKKPAQTTLAPESSVPEDKNDPKIGLAESELKKIVEKAIIKNIRPLREQVEKYEEKVRLHDILGGIGYIMGVMGLLCYLKSKPRQKNNRQK